jgi:hypothetical protein
MKLVSRVNAIIDGNYNPEKNMESNTGEGEYKIEKFPTPEGRISVVLLRSLPS